RPTGDIVEVLSERYNFRAAQTAIYQHQIPHVWSPEVEAEGAKVPAELQPVDYENRLDLRKMPFVTIDGEDAKDFDDAVYAEAKSEGGWTLWVAIADVSHYVRPGTAIDAEAQLRATSVYFPGMVVPMLPSVLSDELCSLKPAVDRLALVCEMDISHDGLVKSKSFHSAVIHSHARLTYRVASAMLDGEHFPAEFAHAKSWVSVLGDLFRALLAQRVLRNAIEFDTQETTILFNSAGTVVDIVPVVRGIAHRVIEECMLAANVSAAEFLTTAKEPILYRVHPSPSGEKLKDLKAFLKDRAISVPAGEVWSSQEYNAVIQSVQGRDDAFVLQMMLLRSMNQAYYSPINLGHFGLAHPSYGHFTSPIRRYPDLL
ncbi:MAG: VacB/RNase II family 3'-5' exoribonuclease, partial [Pseudomonadota bacterium]